MGSSQKGLNKITTQGGVVYDLAGKQIDGNVIADLTDLGSNTNGKGASRIGLEDPNSLIVATNVESALQENRALIDSNSLGLGSFWECVSLIATSNVSLTGEQTIDTDLTSTSRVLLTAQTDASENGLWLTAAGAWARTNDADADAEYTVNKTLCAMNGSRAGQTWAYTGDSSPVLDTDNLVFAMKSGSNIADGSITAAKLASDSVITAKILDGNVTTAKLAADAVDGTKLADDSVDSEHIAAGAIDAEHFSAGSVDTSALGSSQVTTAKLAADAVDGTKLADDSVDSEHIAAGAVDTEHLGALQVTTAKLAADAVDGSKLADDSVDSEHIAAGSIDASHFSADAENNKFYVTQIDFDSASTTALISSCPSGAHILEVMVKVTTVFDGTSPTLSIGVPSGTSSDVAGTSLVDLTSSSDNPQVSDVWYTMGSTENVNAHLSVSGASAGSCLVAVRRVL